ncbi:MAG: tetratricopeptide repeat protein [Kiritimatiellia bacterium]
MAEITLEALPKKLQDMFNKGFKALERSNLDYAIEMLSQCVSEEPAFLRGWKFLRAAQLKKARKKPLSSLSRGINIVTGLPAYGSAMAMMKANKPHAALMAIDRVMGDDPTNPRNGLLFAQAAASADLPELAILTLELVRESHPEDVAVLGWLGGLYQKMGRMRSARECFERLCEMNPNDPNMLKQLKDVMALDSMSNDGWEKTAESGGSYRDILKDSDEAALLEQEAKSARSDAGVDNLIEDTIKKIEAEPKNVNFRRALANFYMQKKDYAGAIEALEKAVEINPGDPELERTLTNTHIKAFEAEIAAKREAGDDEAAAVMESELLQYKFDDMQARVERYPNDFQLRFEWGVMLYEHDYVNEAIQQLQVAQRSVKNRVQSLYYLGLCFISKKQYDVAFRQLDGALQDLPIMDGNKKKVLYELGHLCELRGEPEKSTDYYLQIYQVDIGYRDVASKIENSSG